MSRTPKPTEGELEILQVLWRNGPSTVREVHDELTKTKEAGYTTTLKLMQIMLTKRLVSRKEQGKVHTYSAEVNAQDTRQELVDKLLETAFGGSAADLVMQALGARQPSADELADIRRFLEQFDQPHSQEPNND